MLLSRFFEDTNCNAVLAENGTQAWSILENREFEFDFILDSVGKSKSSQLKESCKNSLNNTGNYMSIDKGALILSSARLDQISKLVVENKIKPIVEKAYSLEQIVEAHEYVQKGHKRGGVAIFINE